MEMKLLFSLLLVVAVTGADRRSSASQKREQAYRRFYQALDDMNEYDRQRLPVFGDDLQPVNVTVDFTLAAVTKLNKKEGYAELEGYLSTRFTHPRLRLQLEQDVEMNFRVDPKFIWTPDIDLYNSVHPGLQIINSRPTAVVTTSGDVRVVNKVRTRTHCDIMGQLSASRVVNCTLKFGSWAYNGLELLPSTNLSPSGILSHYQVTSVWNVTSASALPGSEIYACCPEPYPWVKYSFLMTKRPRN